MADPITLAVVGSTIIGGVSSIQGSLYSAAVADANAQQARYNAEEANLTAQRDAQDLGLESAGFLGEQLASQAGSGITLSSPSAIRSRNAAKRIGRENIFRRIEGGNKESANYLTQSNMFKAEASANRTQAGLTAAKTAVSAYGSYLGDAKPANTSKFNFLPKPVSRPRFYGGN